MIVELLLVWSIKTKTVPQKTHDPLRLPQRSENYRATAPILRTARASRSRHIAGPMRSNLDRIRNDAAGVVQWQYRSFPSFGRGFDSHRPLQILSVRSEEILYRTFRRHSLHFRAKRVF